MMPPTVPAKSQDINIRLSQTYFFSHSGLYFLALSYEDFHFELIFKTLITKSLYHKVKPFVFVVHPQSKLNFRRMKNAQTSGNNIIYSVIPSSNEIKPRVWKILRLRVFLGNDKQKPKLKTETLTETESADSFSFSQSKLKQQKTHTYAATRAYMMAHLRSFWENQGNCKWCDERLKWPFFIF